VEELPGLDAKALQEAAAALLEQLGDPAAVLLASRGEGDSAGRISFAAASSPQVRLKLAFEAASPALSLTEDCFWHHTCYSLLCLLPALLLQHAPGTLFLLWLLAARCTQAIKAGVQAGKVVGAVAKLCDGGGGGKPALAQAGGKDASKMAEAMLLAKELLLNGLPWNRFQFSKFLANVYNTCMHSERKEFV
jgi:DHHA1 domain